MEYLTLKNSDLNVSRICIGGDPMGGHGWGTVDDESVQKAIHAAIDSGINFFDTADTYGLGYAEEILGKSIKDRRDELVIATKFGVRVDKEKGITNYDNSPEWIEKALEGSLRRLQTDYIDLYQIHYRDGKTDMADVVHTLEKLQRKGYIRYFGLSNVHLEDMDEFEPYKGRFISFQDEYSLACRKNEADMFHIAEEYDMTPLTWGSLGQGILTGKYDRNVVFGPDDRRSREVYVNFHGAKLEKNMCIVDEMRKIEKESGKKLPAIAVRFILDYIKDSVVLVGVKSEQQVVSNLEGIGWTLSQEHIKRLLAVSS